MEKLLQEIKELINPNRYGGVSRYELEKAYKLLEELEKAPKFNSCDHSSAGPRDSICPSCGKYIG